MVSVIERFCYGKKNLAEVLRTVRIEIFAGRCFNSGTESKYPPDLFGPNFGPVFQTATIDRSEISGPLNWLLPVMKLPGWKQNAEWNPWIIPIQFIELIDQSELIMVLIKNCGCYFFHLWNIKLLRKINLADLKVSCSWGLIRDLFCSYLVLRIPASDWLTFYDNTNAQLQVHAEVQCLYGITYTV